MMPQAGQQKRQPELPFVIGQAELPFVIGQPELPSHGQDAVYFFAPRCANLLRNFSTRPPSESMLFCVPV